jgi:hypothetical protein
MNEKRLDRLSESLIDFCNAVESASFNLHRKLQGVGNNEAKTVLSEDTFNVLKWQDEKGVRLGDFQVAYKNMNLPDKWLRCYNILKANNSLISNQFEDRGYVYRYWIYPEKYDDRIFRKRVKEDKA